jgi:hypothetical protein
MLALYFAALATGIAGNALLIVQHTNVKITLINQALR